MISPSSNGIPEAFEKPIAAGVPESGIGITKRLWRALRRRAARPCARAHRRPRCLRAWSRDGRSRRARRWKSKAARRRHRLGACSLSLFTQITSLRGARRAPSRRRRGRARRSQRRRPSPRRCGRARGRTPSGSRNATSVSSATATTEHAPSRRRIAARRLPAAARIVGDERGDHLGVGRRLEPDAVPTQPSRSSVALTRFPLCPSASCRAVPVRTTGCASPRRSSRWLRVWPIATSPGSACRTSEDLGHEPHLAQRRDPAAAETAMPADSWPRCCRAKRPKQESRATSRTSERTRTHRTWLACDPFPAAPQLVDAHAEQGSAPDGADRAQPTSPGRSGGSLGRYREDRRRRPRRRGRLDRQGGRASPRRPTRGPPRRARRRGRRRRRRGRASSRGATPESERAAWREVELRWPAARSS